MTRLVVVLGAGGVGKTTLSAALGLGLATTGRRVALLGIDPARRLRSALHLPELSETGTLIACGAGSLRASVLHPRETLDRWVAAGADEAQRARLVANPFFIALADRLAAATDAIAAARVVEWVEAEPALDDVVVDTAPGTAAVEFLARPDKLMAFFDGQLIRWLRRFARVGGAGLVRRSGGRLLAGLARISGTDALAGFGDFISLVEQAMTTLVARLERARAWLRAPSTRLLVVSSITPDAVAAARDLAAAIRGLGLAPTAAILNRALPPSLLAAPPPLLPAPPEAHAFTASVRAHAALQARVDAALGAHFPHRVAVPESPIDSHAALTALGGALLAAPIWIR